MEVAASLVTTAASVTVIGRDSLPFRASLGEQVGDGGGWRNRKEVVGGKKQDEEQCCPGW